MKNRVVDIEATGRNIKRFLEEKGLSAYDVQEALGLESAQSVYAWISPKRKNTPSVENLVMLAQLLEVRIEDILILRE